MENRKYLVKKTVYVDALGKSYDYPRNTMLKFFDNRKDAEIAALKHSGQVVEVRDFIKKSRRNQGWLRNERNKRD